MAQGLLKIRNKSKNNNFKFSIIVAARNEEAGINKCIQSILNQTINSSRFELIIIDDRSTDATGDIIDDFSRSHDNIRALHIKETPIGSPKKNALLFGVKNAKNNLFVFTDADCLVKPTWLDTIDKNFNYNTGALQGVTSFAKENFNSRYLYKMQELEFISHSIVSAAFIGNCTPINSSGNNLAVRREAFEDVNGYQGHQNVISGDDDLLVQSIWKKKWKIKFMSEVGGSVETLAPKNVSEIIDQRKRWGTVIRHYPLFQKSFLTGVFLYYLSIFGFFILGGVDPKYFLYSGLLMGLKIAGDYFLLLTGSIMFKKPILNRTFLPTAIVQVPLILYSVFSSYLSTPKWKLSL